MVVALAFVIVAILIFSFVVLAQQITSLTNASYHLAENQIDNVSNQVSYFYDNYKKMGTILSVSPNLVEYADYGKLEAEHSRPEAHTLSKEMLQLLNVYGQSINTVAAYFPSSDSVVTMSRQLHSSNKGLFFDSHPGLAPEELDKMFSGRYQGLAMVQEGRKTWMVQKVTTVNGNLSYILIEYNLGEIVRQIIANTERILILVGNDDGLLYTNTLASPDKSFSQILQNAADGAMVLDQNYIACYKDTNIDGISVIVGVSSHEIDSIRRQLFLLILITSATVGGSLVFLLYNLRGQIFLPVEKLVTSFQKEDLDTRNALAAISQNISTIEDNRNQLLRERDYLVPVTMGRLIYRIVLDPEDSQNLNRASSCLSIMGISPEQHFAVFSISLVEDADKFFSGQTLAEHGLSRMNFFLDNVLRDLLFAHYPGFVVPVGTTHYEVLVLCPPDAADEVQNAGKELLGFFEECFSVLFNMTGVDLGKSVQDFVNIAIKQAKELSFRSFWGESAEGEPSEDAVSGAFYTYCNMIRRLITGLSMENYDKVWQNLDSLLTKALPVDERNVKNTRYRMYAMTAFLVTSIEEYLGGEREFIESNGFEARLYEADNISDYRKRMRAILQEIVEYKAQNTFVSGRMEDVRRYLLEHYLDSSLSVAAVAEEFGISISYLSRSFKEAFDVNLLEYIQRLRIEQAKKLLRTQTVQSVAKEVGFWEAQALTRAFKKYEGLAPADYKRFLEKEQTWT